VRPTTPDLDAVRGHVRARLVAELAPHLQYHCVAHTVDDVVPGALRIAAGEGVRGHDLILLEVAAWFHDLGFVVQAEGHEEIGIAFAGEELPAFGFDAADLAAVRDLVLATRVPQVPHTHLAEVLADADLDVLGRDDFFDRNAALRAELAAQGRRFSDADWYGDQARFVAAHRYFTATARRTRDAAKAVHLAELQRRAAAASAPVADPG
jgi:uncharacterized protein